MNNRECVLATLQHQQPERTPFAIGFTQPAFQKMAEYYGDPHFANRFDSYFGWLSTELPHSWQEVSPNIWEDQFGVRWNRTIDKDIGVVCNCLITPETLSEYQFPNPDDASRYAGYDKYIQDHPDQFIITDLGFSLFERAWTLVGMENLLMHMLDNPAFVNDLLDRILDYNLKIIDQACAHNIDGMLFGDDWGQQTGLIMGPALWREYIKPRIRQMYQRVKTHGKYVFIHSCGKVDSVFPDLIECGLDVFNPFQPEVMDVYEMKSLYGNKLGFYGGISTQRLLPFGTPAEVKTEVRRLLAEVGKNGGYIASPAHAIPGDAKPENIDAMIEVLHAQ